MFFTLRQSVIGNVAELGVGSHLAGAFRCYINVRRANQNKRMIINPQPEYWFTYAIQQDYFSGIALMNALDSQHQPLQWNAARP